MARGTPKFPPDVARALQAEAGEVSFRLTLAAPIEEATPGLRAPLMETPYEAVLCALELDPDGSIRFVRTGSAGERPRVLRIDTAAIGLATHLDVAIRRSREEIAVEIADRDDPTVPRATAIRRD